MEAELKLQSPKSLSDITLQQYQKYVKIFNSWNKEDEEFIKIKMLQVFAGLKVEDTNKVPLDTFNSVIADIIDVLQDETPLVRKFTMNGFNKEGEATEVEFGFIYDLDKMTYGEFVDLQKYINNIQDLHKTMAVLYRPINHSKKEFYRIDDYEGSSKYSNVMKDAPLNVALGAMVFFYRLMIELKTHTALYSHQKMMKEVKTPQDKLTLEENGDSFNQYILLQKETLRCMKRYPIPLYTRV